MAITNETTHKVFGDKLESAAQTLHVAKEGQPIGAVRLSSHV